MMTLEQIYAKDYLEEKSDLEPIDTVDDIVYAELHDCIYKISIQTDLDNEEIVNMLADAIFEEECSSSARLKNKKAILRVRKLGAESEI